MDDMIPVAKEIWSWASRASASTTVDAWLIRILLFFITLAALLKSVHYLLGVIAGIAERWKSLGLPLAISEEHRTAVRRRRQFCRVISSDLQSLAKAENWNDQFFVDLEAEVEVDGGYYASAFARLFRRRSVGVRRVRSLMQAIDTSAEQVLLVVGEPGSGKSVALRHLAQTMGVRTEASKRKRALVPLYVNLREMPELASAPTAEFVKAFVINNVRRGDADTADYVREHWDSYRDQGAWFFLFDSFDEIPAVMHAPTDSPIVKQYAEALRRFVSGIGDCRAVVASREYKSPESSLWPKLRVMPLSERRQQELIANTFLRPNQRDMVERHIALSAASIAQNPMLLALLCRHVKDENRLPGNDHDLLRRHITKLASRDPEYISANYRLTSRDLLEAASLLACLFAKSSGLSLAPTRDEIVAGFPPGTEADRIDRLLGALVEVKICRSDVREARSGDRRFAFSHRRYQEVLFVDYLVTHPNAFALHELITAAPWRDYVVALLQTRDDAVTRPFYLHAGMLLDGYAAQDEPCRTDPCFGGGEYFLWSPATDLHVLRTISEGASRNPSGVPDQVRAAVERLLLRRFREGDLVDWVMVLEFAHLLPAESARLAMTVTRSLAIQGLDQVLFPRVHLMPVLPLDAHEWIRFRLSDELLHQNSGVERLRIETAAERLPSSIGVQWIIRRCNRARGAYRVLGLIPGLALSRISDRLGRSFAADDRRLARSLFVANLLYATIAQIPFVPGVYRMFVEVGRPEIALPAAALWGLIVAVVVSNLWIAYFLRAEGRPANTRLFLGKLARIMRMASTMIRAATGMLALAALAMLTPGLLLHGYATGWSFTLKDAGSYYTAGSLISCSILLMAFLASRAHSAFLRLRQLRALRHFTNAHGAFRAVRAHSIDDLIVWLHDAPYEVLRNERDLRSLTSLFGAAIRDPSAHSRVPVLQRWRPSRYECKLVANRLLEVAEALMHRSEAEAGQSRQMRTAPMPSPVQCR